MFERTSVGLDVHARTVAGCALDAQTGEIILHRMTPDHGEILAWILSLPSPVRVVYEAGPTGFGLARFLLAAGIGTAVAAPSKLQRPSGDRVKTDAKDALHLARLLKLGEVTGVRIPSADQEAARDLVRSRDDVRGDLMRSRHRISGASRSLGSITKTGNSHARRLLVEAAWHHRRPYNNPSRLMRSRREEATSEARTRGHAGNRRLHERWIGYLERRKRPVIANVAIARELSGWCRSLAAGTPPAARSPRSIATVH